VGQASRQHDQAFLKRQFITLDTLPESMLKNKVNLPFTSRIPIQWAGKSFRRSRIVTSAVVVPHYMAGSVASSSAVLLACSMANARNTSCTSRINMGKEIHWLIANGSRLIGIVLARWSSTRHAYKPHSSSKHNSYDRSQDTPAWQS
jgi:hypothetical protein